MGADLVDKSEVYNIRGDVQVKSTSTLLHMSQNKILRWQAGCIICNELLETRLSLDIILREYHLLGFFRIDKKGDNVDVSRA